LEKGEVGGEAVIVTAMRRKGHEVFSQVPGFPAWPPKKRPSCPTPYSNVNYFGLSMVGSCKLRLRFVGMINQG
jgi:hypothetical protein